MAEEERLLIQLPYFDGEENNEGIQNGGDDKVNKEALEKLFQRTLADYRDSEIKRTGFNLMVRSLLGISLGLLSGVAHGVLSIAIEYVEKVGNIPPFQVLFINKSSLVILLMPILLFNKIRVMADGCRDRLMIFLRALICNMGNALLLYAIHYAILIGNVMAIVCGTQTIVIALLTAYCLREPWKKVNFVGILLNLVGIILIAKREDSQMPAVLTQKELIGYGIAVASAIVGGCCYAFTRRLTSTASVPTLLIYEGLLGSALGVTMTYAVEKPVWSMQTGTVSVALVGVGIISSIATLCASLSVQLESPTTVILLVNTQVVVAYLTDYVVFHSTPTPTDIAGASLIVLSSIIVSLVTGLYNLKEEKEAVDLIPIEFSEDSNEIFEKLMCGIEN